jgi:hypothetical protein
VTLSQGRGARKGFFPDSIIVGAKKNFIFRVYAKDFAEGY